MLDPYKLFGFGSARFEALRLQNSFPLNYALWKMIAFQKNPAAHILLGDSRMDALPAGRVSKQLGEPVANLAYGGGTLQEAIDTFWFATQTTRLKSVTLGLNFNHYSDYDRTYRTEAFQSIQMNPLLYFTNRTVMKAAAYMVWNGVRGVNPQFGAVTQSKDEFWKETLRLVGNYYTSRVDPVQYRRELKKIAAYCRENNIQLRFLIHPTHTDLQQITGSFHLEQAEEEFRRDLASLAPVYDYDYPTEWTRNRDAFRDPFHLTNEFNEKLADEVWTGPVIHGRIAGQ